MTEASAAHPGSLSSQESTIIHRRKIEMGVFRYADKYAAPTKEQRERYMTGKSEEHHFGPGGQIVLIEYHEAAYLKDDIDDIRILFTGSKDKQKAREEAKLLADRHEHKAPHKNLFTTGRKTGEDLKSSDHKTG
jgi:hypothetical protein